MSRRLFSRVKDTAFLIRNGLASQIFPDTARPALIAFARMLELAHNRRRSRKWLVARNLRRFRRMVQDLSHSSPYYARVMKARGIDPQTASVADFPPLTKTLLLQHFDEIITDPRVTKAEMERFLSGSKEPLEPFKGEFVVVHTSGSDGRIAPFVWRRTDWLRGLVTLSRAVPLAIARKVAFIGATDGHYAGVTMTQSSGSRPLGWSNRVRVFDVRNPIASLVADLNGYQPAALIGYAMALGDLAREKLARRLMIAPRTIISGGEPLLPGDRGLIESAFGARVTNLYAASEHMVIAIGHPGLQGMVLQEDDLIVEPRGDHTLITNLLNTTLPLIRYRMDDALLPLDDTPRGWRPYRMVQDVVGRKELAPRFLNEAGEWDTIHPIVFVEFFVPGLQGFQVLVHDGHSFTFLAVLHHDVPRAETIAAIRSRLDSLLHVKKMRNVNYQVKIVDGMSVDARTGKFQLVRFESRSS